MRITVVGAGPVGLLTACLLSFEHAVTVLDKRTCSTRDHGLNIDTETIDLIINYLETCSGNTHCLCNVLHSWKGIPVSTVDIESKLSEIASNLGVTIRRGINVESIDNIKDNIIISADGARSKIRELLFGGETVDCHSVGYMAQLKYQTPGITRPRLAISAVSYSFLNGLSGSDLVVDFESLAPPNNNPMKPGTLYIPIPKSVYDVLSADRGNYASPWKLEELRQINHEQVSKLLRIIHRYEFSLKWRGGHLEDARVTVIPLVIYRSSDVVHLSNNNKLIMLVGDSSSCMVYQRGLNKGWKESVQCAITLHNISSETLSQRLSEYSQFCVKLYETERDKILVKQGKIISVNKTTSIAGIVLVSGLGIALGKVLSSYLTM